jgi:hypothetical protein
MSANTVVKAINKPTEMYEDIFGRFSLPVNLKSCIFDRLQRNSGGD